MFHLETNVVRAVKKFAVLVELTCIISKKQKIKSSKSDDWKRENTFNNLSYLPSIISKLFTRLIFLSTFSESIVQACKLNLRDVVVFVILAWVEVPQIISAHQRCFRDLTFFRADSEDMKNIRVFRTGKFSTVLERISAVERCFS